MFTDNLPALNTTELDRLEAELDRLEAQYTDGDIDIQVNDDAMCVGCVFDGYLCGPSGWAVCVWAMCVGYMCGLFVWSIWVGSVILCVVRMRGYFRFGITSTWHCINLCYKIEVFQNFYFLLLVPAGKRIRTV